MDVSLIKAMSHTTVLCGLKHDMNDNKYGILFHLSKMYHVNLSLFFFLNKKKLTQWRTYSFIKDSRFKSFNISYF